MSPLPALSAVLADPTPAADGALAQALALLFEPSPVLTDVLTPQLARALPGAVRTYNDLVDAVLAVLRTWEPVLQAQFVGGHPRIGEVQHLSALSAREQAAAATPPAVLARLAHLNACYERRFPGLRYITFVNGRSREQVMREMEGVLGFPRSLSADEPPVESVAQVDVGGPVWRGEAQRAVEDVGKIAKARLVALGT